MGTINRRLVFGFCLLMLVFLLFGLYSLYDIRTISHLTRTIYDHPLVVSNAALQSNVSITKMHRNMKDVVLFEPDDRIQQAMDAVDQEEALVYQYLDVVRKNILGEKGKNLEEEARILFDNWRPIRKEVIALVLEGKRGEAAEITIGKGADHVEELEKKMLALTNYARKKASSFMHDADQAHSRVDFFLILFFVLAVCISTLIAFFTLRWAASAENELKESRQMLLNAIDYAPIGMVMVEPTGKFYRVNKAFCEITGYSEKDLYGMNFQEITHPDDQDIGSDLVKRLLEGETDRGSFEKRYIKKDGSAVDVYLTTSLIKDSNGSPVYFFTQVQDITDRKLAEQRIEHLNRLLLSIRDVNQLIVRERDPKVLIREACRLLVDNRGYASALIVLTDENNRFVSWAGSGIASSSKPLKEMFGRGEMPDCCHNAQSTEEILVIDDRPAFCGNCPIAESCNDTPSLCVRLVHGKRAFGYVIVALNDDMPVDDEERSLFSEMAGDLAYALNAIRIRADRELSKRKSESLEAQFLQAQKLESVGRLAGGVAHDFNNIIGVIQGKAEMALMDLKSGDAHYDDFQEIHKSAKSAANVTRQLLAFARKQTVAPQVLDLNETIEGMLKMLRRLVGENIHLAWLPGVGVWPIKIDPSQVDQILANLCVNARDAIVDTGKITIETDTAVIDQAYCEQHAGFIPGEYVVLAFSDDGKGMNEETLESIFEPFFTTKAVGEGTGLGLATVHGIVKQNNGFINVYSEPGEGTTFRIYLPRQMAESDQMESEATAVFMKRGEETILLVEDHTKMLEMTKQMLEDLGYQVLATSRPVKAVDVAQAHTGPIHLLITDVVMPDMNGRVLSEKLTATYPEIKCLFMSGYTANVIAHHGVLDKGVHFIQKPFSVIDLSKKVREALGDDIA